MKHLKITSSDCANIVVTILAIISLYIICVVGLGWFWHVGYSNKADQINGVLLNLSYSFITGYVVYLGTVLIPVTLRRKKVKRIVLHELKKLKKDRIIPCIHIFTRAAEYNNSFTDEQYIDQYREGNILGQSFFCSIQSIPSVMSALLTYRREILTTVDMIINKYSTDIPEELLAWLESIDENNAIQTIFADHRLIEIRRSNGIGNQNTTPEENATLAKALIDLRNDFQNHIAELEN